jgi:hypothetical protein
VTAPSGSRWRLGDRSGWSLSGREVEILSVRGGMTAVRVGRWCGSGAVRACDVLVLDRLALRDLLRGAERLDPDKEK